MSLVILKMASVFSIWSSALRICGIILGTSYKVHYVSLGVAPTPHPNHKKSFQVFSIQMIFYRSMERILYHLVWVDGGWLVKKLKIVEKLSGLYGSANHRVTGERLTNPAAIHCLGPGDVGPLHRDKLENRVLVQPRQQLKSF